ncbi:hypothetical protein C8Q72DRAFT_951184 [Fomitopsis betulina]|nr:hypothetical protein C8Q72DRAFT_951184 [Fomitopsis betulina]
MSSPMLHPQSTPHHPHVHTYNMPSSELLSYLHNAYGYLFSDEESDDEMDADNSTYFGATGNSRNINSNEDDSNIGDGVNDDLCEDEDVDMLAGPKSESEYEEEDSTPCSTTLTSRHNALDSESVTPAHGVHTPSRPQALHTPEHRMQPQLHQTPRHGVNNSQCCLPLSAQLTAWQTHTPQTPQPRVPETETTVPEPSHSPAPQRKPWCQVVVNTLDYLQSRKMTLGEFLRDLSWGEQECTRDCTCHSRIVRFRAGFFNSRLRVSENGHGSGKTI